MYKTVTITDEGAKAYIEAHHMAGGLYFSIKQIAENPLPDDVEAKDIAFCFLPVIEAIWNRIDSIAPYGDMSRLTQQNRKENTASEGAS
ncbi:MAG: hypothetical protein IJD16_04350 [Desulfovibrio sp.]|nr:hypothetical protein [Desulfovibrio sp.]